MMAGKSAILNYKVAGVLDDQHAMRKSAVRACVNVRYSVFVRPVERNCNNPYIVRLYQTQTPGRSQVYFA